ncbi:MAG: hypothetical protein GY866_12480 [Proteobacteria bacterium]|nr:hypothetical protein [Pseudomonadota bacterium]
MNKMTGRERVLAAIRYQEPDRVPIDLGAMVVSGIMAICYNKLKAYLGIEEGRTRVYEPMQQLAVVEKPILDRFHIDAVGATYRFDYKPEAWKPWTLPDGSDAYISLGFNPESDGAGGQVVKDLQGFACSFCRKSGVPYDIESYGTSNRANHSRQNPAFF